MKLTGLIYLAFFLLINSASSNSITNLTRINQPNNLADFDGDGIDDSVDLDDDNDGIPDAIECGEVYCGENVVNGSFEQPIVANGTWDLFHENSVPGWKTTATDRQIELWRSGFLGVPASQGNQLAELNANQVAALYQELCISGGSTVQWSVKHRGRDGVDVAQVKIGADLASATVVETMSDGTGAWGTYTGTYVVPDGQDTTFFIFEAVSSSGGSNGAGNLIDDIVITILQEPICSADFDGDGIPNSFDLDSDNDGIYDIVESGNGHLDTNNDGIIDNAETNSGANGLANNIETIADNGIINFTVLDSDSDGNLDIHELDSDNDGCFDVVEAGYTDTDNNGLLGNNPITVNIRGVVTSGTDGYTPPLDGDTNGTLDFQEAGTNLAINMQPVAQMDCKGESIMFEVQTSEPAATGYQWEVNTGGSWTTISDNINYSGSTSNQLQIFNVPANFDGYQYRVLISHLSFKCDLGLTSNEVLLTVYDTPEPTSANSVQEFCDIENATIANLVVTGTNTQWYDMPTGGTLLNTGQNLIDNTIYYVTQTLNNCESQTRLAITANVYETVIPLVAANIPALESCDTAVGGTDTDGVSSFNLRDRETLLLNGKNASDYNFRYFTDATRLVSNEITGASISAFENTTSPNAQIIYVRIENNGRAACYTDTTIQLVVHPLPVVASVVDLIQCDDGSDGISPFNLTEANVLISADHLNETITYYETQAEAEVGLTTNQISNFTAYPNATPLSDVIYSRIETVNGCYRTVQVNLTVGVSQIPASFSLPPYYECDTKEVDNDNTNGVATFNFSDAKTQIEALFPGGITVTFYNNEADALAELNAIPDIANHRNEGYPNTQNIYVRVDSDAVNACLGLGHHVTLHVAPLPIKQTIAPYVLCSDTNEATFNLTTKASEIIGTQPRPILISYHESEQDAINNIPITNPTSYTSTSKIIYIRAQFDDNGNGMLDTRECVNTDMTFELTVNPKPILTQPDLITICSEQDNTVYDLTIRANQITNNDSSITLAYFESAVAITNNTPILVPDSYLNTQLDRDIIVVATGANGCTSTTTLSLKTILYANLNENPLPIEECETDNNGFDNFDIRRRETAILNGLNAADFTFTYYELETDAIVGNANAIQSPESFINTVKNTQTIYARVLPVNNACFIVVPLTLIVNPVPEIAIEDEYVICLNASNQSITPALSTFLPNPPIDTKLNIATYSFQWYNGSEAEVMSDPSSTIITGAINATYTPVAAGDYTVIATNRTTGCTIPASTKVIGSYPPESITVELGSDAFSGNNILDITVVGNGEYEYRLDTTDWQREPRFEKVRGGERTIYVRDIYNCNEITTMQVIIDYPKYFTPNGDGTNDTWNIRGIATQPQAKIYIYDRYGKLLKQLRPNQIGWNGTFNGKLMPVNDYWFTVEYKEPRDNIIKIFKAHFALKR